MARDIPLKCTCGEVRGVARDVTPDGGTRLVCYCDDCQSYAHFLEREDDLLDESGGTDIFQLTPAQLEFYQGAELLVCVRQSPKGAVRWYTSCCRTPVANTMAVQGVPFAGVPHLLMDHEADGVPREQALGPIRAKIQGRYAKGGARGDLHEKAPPGFILRAVGLLAVNRLKGRHRPSPFWREGELRVAPKLLSKQERQACRQRCCGGEASWD